MLKRLAVIFLLMVVWGGNMHMRAQTVNPNACPYAGHTTKLACLIPEVTNTANSNLSSFNTTISQVLGQLPLAAPVSSVVLGFDKATAQFRPLSENLGSVLTERGSTVGKSNLFIGFTAQRFVFHTIDGIDLKNLPTVEQITGTTSYAGNSNFLSANLNQYSGILAFGLTRTTDVSITVPFERVSLSGGYTNYQVAHLSTDSMGNTSGVVNPGSPPTNFIPGSASGFGDILLNLKQTVYSGEKNKLAFGLEVRLPTGDEFNFLGSGAYGYKPYMVFSRVGRWTPHVNLGYQRNTLSALYLNPQPCAQITSKGGPFCNTILRLPPSLDYSAGVDYGVVKDKFSIVGDWIGQHYFDSPKLTAPVAAGGNVPGLPNCSGSIAGACSSPQFVQFTQRPTVGLVTDAVNVNDLSVGLKAKPFSHTPLIFSANALIRLDNGGLRPDRFVPLVGISYLFSH